MKLPAKPARSPPASPPSRPDVHDFNHILVAFGIDRGNAALLLGWGLPESAESTSVPLNRCDRLRTSPFHTGNSDQPEMPTRRCERFVRLSARAPRRHRSDGPSMTARSRFRALTQTRAPDFQSAYKNVGRTVLSFSHLLGMIGKAGLVTSNPKPPGR